MSFTTIKRFLTIMKELQYPHVISVESFQCPNFEFVAKCLYWLLLRYDPTINLDKNIPTEISRINFVKSVAKLMHARAKIKLNAKYIYSADGYAVKELLKIATILQAGTKNAISLKNQPLCNNKELITIEKPFNAKITRTLVNEITKCGTTVYDMLLVEPKFKEQRDQTLILNKNVDKVEHKLQEAIETMIIKTTHVDQEVCHVEDTHKLLQSKYEKKMLELERCKTRLSSLQNVKPAYVDQYDEMQVHLHDLFSQYIKKFQNLKWLETQMESYNCGKQETFDKIIKMHQFIQNEEVCLSQYEELDNDSAMNEEKFEDLNDEGINIWDWFHDRTSKSKKRNVLEALNTDTEKQPHNMQMPTVQSNWEVHKLCQNIQKMPFGKNDKGCFARKYCEDYQTNKLNSSTLDYSDIEPSRTNSIEASINKFGGEETEDELLDIDVATCTDGSDGDSNSDGF